MIKTGDKWICPRCKQEVIITNNGVHHLSKTNGPHWQKYSLDELNSNALHEKEQLNKLFYGN